MTIPHTIATLFTTVFWLLSCVASDGHRFKHEISTPTTVGARIVFPGQKKFNQKPRPTPFTQLNESDSQIPVSLFLKNSIKNADDFIKGFVINKDDFQSAIPVSSFPINGTIIMRANSGVRTGDLIQMAHCEPQLTPVELDKSSDPAVIYFPSCTRIERCGGCCMHDLLACEPTKTETLKVKVMKARYQPGTEGFQHEGFEHLELVKHSSCECRCKTKEEDCNALQDYHPNECKCVCRNEQDIEKCTGENRFWDPRTCQCHCRNIRECSTGFYYDTETCTCLPERNAAPVFRIPTGFNWRTPPQTYDISWSSNRRRVIKRNENSV